MILRDAGYLLRLLIDLILGISEQPFPRFTTDVSGPFTAADSATRDMVWR